MAQQSSRLRVASAPARTIRVLLDARKILDGGIGVYLQNLIASFIDRPGFDLTLLVNPGQLELIKEKDFPWFADVAYLEDPAKVLSWDEFNNLATRIPQEQFDLYHSPYITLPRGLKIPSIVTVHDLIQLTHPEKFYYPFLGRILIGNSISRATRILTGSKASLSLLKKYFSPFVSVDSKTDLVTHVISPEFLNYASPELAAKKFNLKGDYLLGIYSNLKPHKGLVDLLKVFKQLKKTPKMHKIPKNLKLVLVGKGFANITENDHIFQMIDSTPDVLLFGRISDAELSSLYSGANALVVASKQEGFCLPIIQAHAQGTPVIARPVPAVKEILTAYDFQAKDFKNSSLRDAIVSFYQSNCPAEIPELKLSLAKHTPNLFADKMGAVYNSLVS